MDVRVENTPSSKGGISEEEQSTTEEEPPSPGEGTYNSSPLKRLFRTLLNILHLRKDSSFEESVAELIEEHEAEGTTTLRPEERNILTNAVSFRDLRVDDILVPRSDIVAVSEEVELKELRQTILEKEHTRMPVYHGSLDDIKGFVHIKDLIQYLGENIPFTMKDIIRDILVVPPSMAVSDLLMRMRDARVHMALVVDEHGGTDGLVTIEDIMEEIVGEIKDEHDDILEEATYKKISDSVIEASARLDVDELEKMLKTSLFSEDENDDFDTIGGLIFNLARRVPKTGEVITHSQGISFTILDADPRRINRVRIEKKHPPEEA